MKLAVKRTLPRGFILAIAMHDGGYVHLEQGAVEPLPEDYNGYMKQFDVTADEVVRQYTSEALNTYIRERILRLRS